MNMPPRTRWTTRTAGAHRERRHRFSVGQLVTIAFGGAEVRPRGKEIIDMTFEITRLLPEQQDSFQYRVKDSATGRERVVAEEQIGVKE